MADIVGTIEVNEFGWVHITLNTLLPNCKYKTPHWLQDTLAALLSGYPKNGRKPPRFERNGKWIADRYWHSKGNRNWIFCTEATELLCLGSIPIIRHTKVRMNANPYLDTQYFIDRKFQQGVKRPSGRFKQVWTKQSGCCYHCGLPIEIRGEKEIFYKVPRTMGGKEDVGNMAYVHKHCQMIFLECRANA